MIRIICVRLELNYDWMSIYGYTHDMANHAPFDRVVQLADCVSA